MTKLRSLTLEALTVLVAITIRGRPPSHQTKGATLAFETTICGVPWSPIVSESFIAICSMCRGAGCEFARNSLSNLMIRKITTNSSPRLTTSQARKIACCKETVLEVRLNVQFCTVSQIPNSATIVPTIARRVGLWPKQTHTTGIANKGHVDISV